MVASDFPSWRKIVEGKKCGLIEDPLNPKKIAAAIEYLRSYPERRWRMSENGRWAVWKKFDWQQRAKKLLTLYAKLTVSEIQKDAERMVS